MKRPLTVRLDDDVRAALERLAQRDSRSLSAMIQTLIKNQALKDGCYVHPPLSAVAKKSN